jgi:hypothetical protein
VVFRKTKIKMENALYFKFGPKWPTEEGNNVHCGLCMGILPPGWHFLLGQNTIFEFDLYDLCFFYKCTLMWWIDDLSSTLFFTLGNLCQTFIEVEDFQFWIFPKNGAPFLPYSTFLFAPFFIVRINLQQQYFHRQNVLPYWAVFNESCKLQARNSSIWGKNNQRRIYCARKTAQFYR